MKAFYCLIIYLSIHLYGYAILPTQFHFRHYNIENGISANNISALLQDQKGFIWIGTDNGLSRFDGNQFTFSLNPQLHSRSATYIKRNGLLIRKITIKSSRPFQCAYHPLTP